MELCVPDLGESLAALLRQIPRGRVTTYGRLAEALGSRSAARWVGEYLVDHLHGGDCPCHRVVRSTGEPGRFIGDDDGEKVRRLEAESIPLERGRVDLADYGIEADELESSRPLERLIEAQHEIARSVKLRPFSATPALVAGVDVSYPASGGAVAAYVLVETETGRLVWSETLERSITFPYVSGFLTFRELPLLLELFDRAQSAGRRAELVFVDGNGILHPRRAGIAACFGVLTGIPTIGIGKKLLLGSVDLKRVTPAAPQFVVADEYRLGAAMKAKSTSRPIFVSPGHLVDLEDALRMTRLLLHGHRLPEPVFHADAVSRSARASERIPTVI